MMEDYYKINKEAWNARTEIHLHSSFYDLNKFKREVKSVPDLDLSLLGNVRGEVYLASSMPFRHGYAFLIKVRS